MADLGAFLARDGSHGARVGLDLEFPHVGLLTGKRGSGKSHTLGVIAEGLGDADGVTGVLVDPMGVFDGLAEEGAATIIENPAIPAASLDARTWCSLLDLETTSAAGALLWRVADAAESLEGMQHAVEHAQAPPETL